MATEAEQKIKEFKAHVEKELQCVPNYSKIKNVSNLRYTRKTHEKYPNKIIQIDMPDNIITRYLKRLSFSNYVLAGNSVANIIEEIPITGDLDFFVNSDYLKSFEEILAGLVIVKVSVQPSLIDIRVKIETIEITISIIHSDYIDPKELIFKFDLDYCRAYINESGIFAYEEALFSIATKTINEPYNLRPYRIQKAIKNGYSFHYDDLCYNMSSLVKTIPRHPGIVHIKIIDEIINIPKIVTFEKFLEIVELNSEIKKYRSYRYTPDTTINEDIVIEYCTLSKRPIAATIEQTIENYSRLCYPKAHLSINEVYDKMFRFDKLNRLQKQWDSLNMNHPLIIHESDYIDKTTYDAINMVVNQNNSFSSYYDYELNIYYQRQLFN